MVKLERSEIARVTADLAAAARLGDQDLFHPPAAAGDRPGTTALAAVVAVAAGNKLARPMYRAFVPSTRGIGMRALPALGRASP
jgi:hypothetical protein